MKTESMKISLRALLISVMLINIGINASICPRGTFKSGSICSTCLAGNYANLKGSCLPCPNGYYCKDPSKFPTPCPIGTFSFSVSGNITSCQSCPPGYFTSKNASTYCILCPNNNSCNQSEIYSLIIDALSSLVRSANMNSSSVTTTVQAPTTKTKTSTTEDPVLKEQFDLLVRNLQNTDEMIQQMKIVTNVLDLIKAATVFFGPEAAAGFSAIINIFEMGLGLFEPQDNSLEIIMDALQDIYNQIIELNRLIRDEFDNLSNEIKNLQIVLTANENINRMTVYIVDAENYINDLQLYLSENVFDIDQFKLLCGTSFNSQHYLNIINRFAQNSILDDRIGSEYNLFYNLMIINDFTDFSMLSYWYQKLIIIAHNLAYMGQMCNHAMYTNEVALNRSSIVLIDTYQKILDGFEAQAGEVRARNLGDFVGCYNQTDNNNQISSANASTMLVKLSKTMNVQYCTYFCSLFSYQYAGLINGDSCWCANQYNKGANISFSNCQTPCDYLDTNRQFCGGVNSTAIYKTLTKTPCLESECEMTIDLKAYWNGLHHRFSSENKTELVAAGWSEVLTWSYTILARPFGNQTVPIYECQSYGDFYISTYIDCEGWTNLRTAGHLFNNSSIPGTTPLWRCVSTIDNDHWVSGSPHLNTCDGGKSRLEAILGYYLGDVI